MLFNEIDPLQFSIFYENRQPEDNDLFIGCRRGEALAGTGPEQDDVFTLPTVGQARKAFGCQHPGESMRFAYLCRIDETRFFISREQDLEPFGPYGYRTLRWFRNAAPQHLAYAVAVADQIRAWYRKNRFCGRCGHVTVHSEKERMLQCPNCGSMIYPQICPSVIVGIIRGGKLLVTKYNPDHVMLGNGTTHAPHGNYALVAGYMEVGETPEDTVRREALEEVGLRVKNIRYYKSQPWPFSGALLLGYYCEPEGDDDVVLEEAELSSAEWKAPEELPDRSRDVSLTSEMIEMFRVGKVK